MRSRRFAGLVRTVKLEELVQRVLAAMRSMTPAELQRLLVRLDEEVRAVTDEHAALSKLSPRERQVFDLVSHGASNGAVARMFGISVKTVQTQRAAVNRKLGVRSPADLVRFAARAGVL